MTYLNDNGKTDWPIFFKDQIKIGNLNSSVAICTLWTKKEIIYSKIPNDKYAVCGNLYTIQGINYLIKNILANPKIRYIILCGNDLMKSGEALINLIKYGVDSDKKIVNSFGFIDSSIDLSLIELFRKNVQVIDMRGKEEEIPKKLEELKDLPPFSEPIFIKEPENKIDKLYSEEIGFKVSGKTVGEAWLKILDIIMKFGEEKLSEHGLMQKEILNLMVIVENCEEKIDEWLRLTKKELKNYYKTFFSKKVPKGVQYTYGNRLFNFKLNSKSFDQVENAIKHLKKNINTRRAFASLWNVELDSDTRNTNPPCIVQISWNVKNNKLYQTATIRSNDMFNAWPFNAFALIKLQKTVANEIGLDLGYLTTFSISAHIYENNWQEVKEILNNYYSGKIMKFEQDKNGYFIISVENGEIIVQHHLPDGRKSNYTFRGNKAQILYRKVLNENLISRLDHAAYLGHELARAEIALKEGKKFIQDEA
jgi:thymidylate synthase